MITVDQQQDRSRSWT